MPIRLGFPPEFLAFERGGDFQLPLFFGITGTAVERVPFFLLPLTYRQFEDRTGRVVENVFSGVVIPPPASDGETTDCVPAAHG